MACIHQPNAPLLDPLIAFRGAVMEGAEDLVPGVFISAVVAVNEAVVQLVHEVAELDPETVHQLQLIVSTVGGWACNRVQHQIEEQVDRMAGNEEVQYGIRVQSDVLKRMHGVT